MAANTKLLEVKNAKGEVMVDVRGQSLYDAQYIGGVPAEYLKSQTTSSITKVSEKT